MRKNTLTAMVAALSLTLGAGATAGGVYFATHMGSKTAAVNYAGNEAETEEYSIASTKLTDAQKTLDNSKAAREAANKALAKATAARKVAEENLAKATAAQKAQAEKELKEKKAAEEAAKKAAEEKAEQEKAAQKAKEEAAKAKKEAEEAKKKADEQKKKEEVQKKADEQKKKEEAEKKHQEKTGNSVILYYSDNSQVCVNEYKDGTWRADNGATYTKASDGTWTDPNGSVLYESPLIIDEIVDRFATYTDNGEEIWLTAHSSSGVFNDNGVRFTKASDGTWQGEDGTILYTSKPQTQEDVAEDVQAAEAEHEKENKQANASDDPDVSVDEITQTASLYNTDGQLVIVTELSDGTWADGSGVTYTNQNDGTWTGSDGSVLYEDPNAAVAQNDTTANDEAAAMDEYIDSHPGFNQN